MAAKDTAPEAAYTPAVRPEDSIRFGRIVRVMSEFVRPRRQGRRFRWRCPPTTCTANRCLPPRRWPPTTDRFPSAGRGDRPGTRPGSASEARSPPSGPGGRWRWASPSATPGAPDSAPRPWCGGTASPAQGSVPQPPEYLVTREAAGGEDVELCRRGRRQSSLPVRHQPVAAAPARARRRAPVHPATGRPACPGPRVRRVLARLPGAGRADDRAPRRRPALRPPLRRARPGLQPDWTCPTSRTVGAAPRQILVELLAERAAPDVPTE